MTDNKRKGVLGTFTVERDEYRPGRRLISDKHDPDNVQFAGTSWYRVLTDLPPGTYAITLLPDNGEDDE